MSSKPLVLSPGCVRTCPQLKQLFECWDHEEWEFLITQEHNSWRQHHLKNFGVQSQVETTNPMCPEKVYYLDYTNRQFDPLPLTLSYKDIKGIFLKSTSNQRTSSFQSQFGLDCPHSKKTTKNKKQKTKNKKKTKTLVTVIWKEKLTLLNLWPPFWILWWNLLFD